MGLAAVGAASVGRCRYSSSRHRWPATHPTSSARPSRRALVVVRLWASRPSGPLPCVLRGRSGPHKQPPTEEDEDGPKLAVPRQPRRAAVAVTERNLQRGFRTVEPPEQDHPPPADGATSGFPDGSPPNSLDTRKVAGEVSAEDREEFARMMANAPDPERERRTLERVQRATAHSRPRTQAQRARRRLNGVHAVALSNGRIDTFRSVTGWGDDELKCEQRRAVRSHRPAHVATLRGPRRRGAGRPAARRTGSSSRTSSADPGSDSDGGDGPSPDARPNLSIARTAARYTFACLSVDGEATA